MADQHASARRTALDPPGVLFVLAGLALGWGLIASTRFLYAAQGQVASLATWLPVGYAFAAGMVAAVNPCGILLLPSLLAYTLARKGSGLHSPGGGLRALALGAAATVGFVVLFGLAGLVVGTGGRALARWFPYGGLGVGAVLAVLGSWLALSGRELSIPSATRVWERARPGGGLVSYFAFGLAYGICSLACTLPVFLAVVGSSLATGSLTGAVGSFLAYAVGMGMVLTAALVGVAWFEAATMRWVRGVVPYIHRLAAAFLVAAGVFTVGYWWKAF